MCTINYTDYYPFDWSLPVSGTFHALCAGVELFGLDIEYIVRFLASLTICSYQFVHLYPCTCMCILQVYRAHCTKERL